MRSICRFHIYLTFVMWSFLLKVFTKTLWQYTCFIVTASCGLLKALLDSACSYIVLFDYNLTLKASFIQSHIQPFYLYLNKLSSICAHTHGCIHRKPRVQYLAQGYFDMQAEIVRDWTLDLLIDRWVTSTTASVSPTSALHFKWSFSGYHKCRFNISAYS